MPAFIERSRALAALEIVLLVVCFAASFVYTGRVLAREAAQRHDARVIEEQARSAASPVPRSQESRTRTGAGRAALHPGQPFGMVRVPRLGLKASIRDGVDDATLDVAVGRIPGTSAAPGKGNIAVAAHRDTHFRALRDVRLKDVVQLETPEGTFEYEVTESFVANPADVWVLEQTARPTITLITCYPFTYVGHAPYRFIVRAALVRTRATPSAK